ncbi:MAG TPA: 2-C-methyl-D-erythritol 4-phosphate cytidylyltransferase [Fibrobacteria bacterium]|nr:2-C-methyl-D-erythritol 4-phosphate cytidylyltransferase [Fibrobacteria bacterium]
MGNVSDTLLPPVGVILPAGGQGLRAGSAEPKQFLPLLPGKPVLAYAVEAFSRLDCVRSVALVLPRERMASFAALAGAFPKVRLVEGGAERWISVRNGFRALDPALPYVLVHDVARPFVSEAVIRRCLEAVSPDACVIAALPASDTVKEVSGDLVARTLDRSRLIQVQTPQAFPRSVLEAVYSGALQGGTGTDPAAGGVPTDEAMLAERAGFAVRWVRGSDALRKITGAADLAWAEWMAGRLDAGETLPDA